jgi:hypothetical protein
MPVQATSASREPLSTSFPVIPQIVAVGQGLILVALGAWGFAVTGFSDFAGQVGHQVLWLSVNPLAGVLNLALGIYALIAARRPGSALRAARYLYLGNLFLFLYGVFSLGSPQYSILAANGYTTGLHLILALLVSW